MSFRTRRVLFSAPFYAIFEFFLLKYIFLLVGEVNDVYLAGLAIVIGLIRCLPMFFEAKKSTPLGRLLTTIDVVWMWASLMFLIDIVAIYLIAAVIDIPVYVKVLMLLIVPVLGVYNYYKAHKLVVNEKVLEIDNLAEEINIAHLSDVHFGSVRHKNIIRDISLKLKELEGTCDIAIISGDLADGSCVVEKDDFMLLSDVNIMIFTSELKM